MRNITLPIITFFFLLTLSKGTNDFTHTEMAETNSPSNFNTLSSNLDSAENPLLLPPPDQTQQSQSSSDVHKIDLSNGSKDLANELGPLIINKDGTTGRITNWHQMTEEEKQRTLRIITARNRKRLQVLKEEL